MAAEPLGVWSDRGAEPFGTAPLPVASPRFEALYREHFDRLRRFCLGMTGQAQLAEDVAQETLLRAYVRMERLDLDRPMWPWLKKVATRLVYDHARANREVCAEEPAAAQLVEDETDRFADRDLLDRVLHRLPARQRVAVTLRYLDDWKPAEVAELLNLPRPAVEQLLLRARRSLCAEYRRLGGDRLRVAFWPLFGLVARLRDRIARVASAAGELSASGVALAADTMSILVVAGAMTMSAGVGVASAAVAPEAAAPAPVIARAVEAKAQPRVLAARTVDSPPIAQAARREALAAEPARAVARQQRAATTAPAPTADAAPSTSSMDVTVGAPPATKAASPGAGAKVERTPEKAIIHGEVEVRLEDGPDDPAGAAPVAGVDCTSDVRQQACEVAAGAIDALSGDLGDQ